MLGDWQTAEFESAAALVRSLCRVTALASPREAAQWRAEGDSPDALDPDLVVIALASPGQFPAETVDALRAQLPLTPIVAITGAWCDGELRSGSPWPGVVRVAWHQWSERFPTEAAALSAGRSSAWSLPGTATAEERLLFSAGAAMPSADMPSNPLGLVAIVSDERESADWLLGVCRARGWPAVWMPRWEATRAGGIAIDGLALVVWDVGLITSDAVTAFERLMPRFGGAPVLAVVGFLRPEDVDRLVAAGVAAVMSKPLLTAEICRRMVRIAKASRSVQI
jgi:CheY-like chemotaxis protein